MRIHSAHIHCSSHEAAEERFGNFRVVEATPDEFLPRQDAVAVRVQLAHDFHHLTEVDVGRPGRVTSIRAHRLYT